MLDVVFIVLMILALIGALFALNELSVRMAIPGVIRLLREKNAVGLENAISIDELGVKSDFSIPSVWRRRDYKPDAMRNLVKAKVVLVTADRKVYLSEENLATSKWHKV